MVLHLPARVVAPFEVFCALTKAVLSFDFSHKLSAKIYAII